ncbi:MAG TPA: molybdenum cofactor biosynthesis protein MoaE [Phycisphaerae bacterium]|nr:molybdenum cofactor biosynthesis protein MoaE [Phycisphaerae bacterium]
MAKITIRFFGPAIEMAGKDSMTLDVEAGATVGLLAGRLAEMFPGLGKALGIRLAVNRAYVALDHVLNDGDEIAVIPPVSGGAPEPSAFLTREVIEPAPHLARLSRNESGAMATFMGTVRAEAEEYRRLVGLEYAAYETMAAEQLEGVRQRALKSFAILDAIIVHRLGRLELGETSILVVVSAAHRADAFDACRWIVDTVKTDVPIWKKNLWTDGKAEWVDPTGS